MQRKALIALAAVAACAAQAQTPDFFDEARVQRVEPQVETVQVPREECASQWVTDARPATNYGGVVIGGVTGALIGNQVARRSHNRDAATAAGAVIGAMAGHGIANRDVQPVGEQREVRSCRTVHDLQQRVNGYLVTYEYRGHVQTIVMPEQPGRTIPVRVSVAPATGYHRR